MAAKVAEKKETAKPEVKVKIQIYNKNICKAVGEKQA